MRITVFWTSNTGFGHKTHKTYLSARRDALKKLGENFEVTRVGAVSADGTMVVRVGGDATLAKLLAPETSPST